MQQVATSVSCFKSLCYHTKLAIYLLTVISLFDVSPMYKRVNEKQLHL